MTENNNPTPNPTPAAFSRESQDTNTTSTKLHSANRGFRFNVSKRSDVSKFILKLNSHDHDPVIDYRDLTINDDGHVELTAAIGLADVAETSKSGSNTTSITVVKNGEEITTGIPKLVGDAINLSRDHSVELTTPALELESPDIDSTTPRSVPAAIRFDPSVELPAARPEDSVTRDALPDPEYRREVDQDPLSRSLIKLNNEQEYVIRLPSPISEYYDLEHVEQVAITLATHDDRPVLVFHVAPADDQHGPRRSMFRDEYDAGQQTVTRDNVRPPKRLCDIIRFDPDAIQLEILPRDEHSFVAIPDRSV